MQNYPSGQYDDGRPGRRARRTYPTWLPSPLVLTIAIMAALLFGASYLLNYLQAKPAASTGAPPTVNQIARVDPKHPFDNTPAAVWQEGAAGIQPPPAAAVGRYSAETVAAAMDRAKQLIVAARLDQHVLETYDAQPVLTLLAPHQAEKIRAKLTPGNEAHTWWVTTKLAPGYPLLPVSPRVAGTMTAALNDKGELAIHTNYLIAYAFAAPTGGDYTAMDIVAVARHEVEFDWVEDSSYDQDSQGMWFGDIQGFAYSVNCAVYDQGFLAPNYSNARPAYAPDPHHPEYYFDPSVPISQQSNC